MEGLAKFVEALSGLAWPGLIVFAAWYFRSQIADFAHLVRLQLVSGGAFKWKEFEFKGVELVTFDAKEGRTFKRVAADQVLFDRRHASYQDNKNLFLVHRVRPSGRLHPDLQIPTYDISIYLIPHKSFGRMNDVKEVEYYLGRYFGISEGNYGTKYIVQNGSEGFAVRVNAYGPTLCEARIVFHDGSETTVSRYLDFEGTGYQFREITNADDSKLTNRQEKS